MQLVALALGHRSTAGAELGRRPGGAQPHRGRPARARDRCPDAGRHELGGDEVRGPRRHPGGPGRRRCRAAAGGRFAARRVGCARRREQGRAPPQGRRSSPGPPAGAATASASWVTSPTGPRAWPFAGWPRPISRGSRWSTAWRPCAACRPSMRGSGAWGSALKQLTALKRGDVHMKNLDMWIAGEAEDIASYRAVKSALANNLPKGIKLTGDLVTAPVVSPFTWSAQLADGPARARRLRAERGRAGGACWRRPRPASAPW